MKLNDFLDLLQIFELKALVAALLIYFFYFSRRDSFVVTAFLTICLYFTHFGVEMIYDKLVTMEYEWQLVGYHGWYLTFAFTDFLFMYAAYCINRRFKYRTNKISQFIILTYIILGFVQLMRYADREVFQTGWFADAYSVMIPTLGSSMVMVVCFYVASVISMDYYKTKLKEQ